MDLARLGADEQIDRIDARQELLSRPRGRRCVGDDFKECRLVEFGDRLTEEGRARALGLCGRALAVNHGDHFASERALGASLLGSDLERARQVHESRRDRES